MAQDSGKAVKQVELILELRGAQSVAEVESEIPSLFEEALAQANQEQLLKDGDLRYDIQRAAVGEEVIVILIQLAAGITLAVVEQILVPMLKERIDAYVEERHLEK